MKFVSLIVPTYNEAKNLPLLMEEVWNLLDKSQVDLEFIVVDDNSPDGTGQVAEDLKNKYPIRVIHRSGKLGLGSAVIEGFKMSDRPYLGVMDADLSHDPVILNELILTLGEYDIAMGSRFAKGSTVENWVWWRKMISNCGVWVTKMLTGVKDPLSGYFFLKREVIAGVSLNTVGYKILLEILVKGNRKKVNEIPFKFRSRQYSISKLNNSEYLLFAKQIWDYSFYKLFHGSEKVKNKLIIGLILALAVCLLFFRITHRTLWMDETAVAEYYFNTPNPITFLTHYFSVPDNHPPLYYFLTICIYNIFPLGVLGFRLLSVFAGIGIVISVYYFSRLLFVEHKKAYLAMLLTACSSYFILISQMARYHSLAALFTLLALYFYAKIFLQSYTRKSFVLLILFSVFTVFTDLPHFVYLQAIINLHYFYNFFKKNYFISIKKWLLGQAVVLFAFIPVAYLYYVRIVGQGDGAFERTSLLGRSLLNWITDLFIHFYSFFFGENILPWNWIPFILGCLALMLLCFILGKVIIKKQGTKSFYLLLYFFFAAVILNTIFLNYADPRYNFIVYPKYVFVAFPLFMILLSELVARIEGKCLRLAVIFAIFLVEFIGLVNFYQLKNYFNASYFNNFSGFEFVQAKAKMGDKLIITGDANIGVYNLYKYSYFSDLLPVEQFMVGRIKKGERVWIFSTGSDDSGVNNEPSDKIPAGFKIVSRYESVPLDPTLKKLKEKILHHGSYQFKYGVYLIVKE